MMPLAKRKIPMILPSFKTGSSSNPHLIHFVGESSLKIMNCDLWLINSSQAHLGCPHYVLSCDLKFCCKHTSRVMFLHNNTATEVSCETCTPELASWLLLLCHLEKASTKAEAGDRAGEPTQGSLILPPALCWFCRCVYQQECILFKCSSKKYLLVI